MMPGRASFLGDVNQQAGQAPLEQYADGLGILGPHAAVGAADRSIASVGCQSTLPLGQAEIANEDLAVCGVVVVQQVLQLQVAVTYPILVYAVYGIKQVLKERCGQIIVSVPPRPASQRPLLPWLAP